MSEDSADNRDLVASSEQQVTQYLTFLVDGETFAIDILDVNEIIEIEYITRVPMTPDYIRGVINLRGSVVPVVELSHRLGKHAGGLTKKSCIVLVEVCSGDERQTIGMMVDEVNEILEIDSTDIQPPPNFGATIRTDFIRAMGRVEDNFIVLLDVDHVLSVEELSSLNELANESSLLPKLDATD